jgi:hypothetical protein
MVPEHDRQRGSHESAIVSIATQIGWDLGATWTTPHSGPSTEWAGSGSTTGGCSSRQGARAREIQGGIRSALGASDHCDRTTFPTLCLSYDVAWS